MTADSLIIIHWHGKESISDVTQLINEHQNIELSLPADFHHACYGHLYPDTDSGLSEFIDIENGVEILSKISKISGLEELSSLIEPIQKTGAIVLMKSPTPRLYIGFKFHQKWFN